MRCSGAMDPARTYFERTLWAECRMLDAWRGLHLYFVRIRGAGRSYPRYYGRPSTPVRRQRSSTDESGPASR